MKKLVKWVLIVLVGLIGLVLLAGVALYPGGMEQLNRSYPGVQVKTVDIPTSPNMVARGSHIAVVWGCTKCHGEDLSGKLIANDPFLGTIPSANLTAGQGGIAGAYTDTDWVRAIRHGIKPNNRVEIIMDDYSTMSDQDLGALIAYLKQIRPVDSDQPAMRLGPILPIASAVGLLTPAAERIDHNAPRPADPVLGAAIEYGKYLSVLCAECHGGQPTGLADKVRKWQQDDFIRTFQTGVLPGGKQLNPAMRQFNAMNDTELTALWLYLQSLQSPSVSNK
ncbi:MAG: c-type cytochrome [Anaerolineae bacterium]|nr:c-type cytochrome [Anaerolineae bacterium]